MVQREYDDSFIEEFTKIWERHNVTKEQAMPKGKWETIDRYVASPDAKVYMRVNKVLGLYMPELVLRNRTESDVRDNEADAIALFNVYVARAFSQTQSKPERRVK